LTASVDVRLLGGFAVTIDGRTVPDGAWSQRRAVELVQLLALAPGHRLLRDEVLEALWPDLDPAAGAANLHKAAHHARRALGRDDGVVLRAGAVALFPGLSVATDLERFEREAAAALAAGDPVACARLAEACPGGDLLPTARYESWAEPARTRAERLWLALLRAGRCWERLAEADPTDEEAQQRLMVEGLAAGRPQAVLGRYRRLRAALRDELGVEPAEESQRLRRRALDALARPRPPLLGRDAELARLRGALADARAGRVRALLLRGDAGMGKTALLERVLADAEADGWRVLRVGADPAGSLPYALLAEIADGLLAGRGGAAAPPPGTVGVVLAGLRLAARGGGPATAAEPPTRQQIAAALTRVVGEATPPGGLLLAVDDAHAADEASLRVLQLLTGAELGCLLVALAFRHGAVVEPIERCREALAGRAVELELGPLDVDATRALVVRSAPTAPTGETVNRIWALTAGHPFFALELARAIDRDGRLAVPPRLREIAAPLLAGLTAPEVEDLERLAVAAARFDAATARAVLGQDEAATAAVLEAGQESGVLVEERPLWRFGHELLRESIAGRVPPERRRAIHRDAAARLERSGAAPQAVARHWLAADEAEPALPHLLAAAERAASVGAFADALGYVDAVLSHFPKHSAARLLRADLLFAAGAPAAPAAYAEARSAAPPSDEAAVRIRQAWAMLIAGDVPGAREALGGLGAVEGGSRLRLAITRGIARWFAGEIDGAAADAADARRLAEEAGSTRDLIDAAMLEAMVAHSRGAWPEWLHEQVLRTAPTPELASAVIDGHLCVAEVWLYGAVPYRKVIAFAEGLAAEAARIGAARGLAFATTLAGEALLLSGQLDEAKERLDESARLHRSLGASGGEALALQRLAEAAVAEARLADARATLARALEAARHSPFSARHLLQRIYGTRIRAAGSPAMALAAIADAAMAVEGPAESCPFCLPTLAIPAAIAAADAGRVDLASAQAALAERTIRATWERGGWIAALAEARAHIARAEGDLVAAARSWAEAELEYARCGQPLDAGRCARARASLPTPAAGGVPASHPS
jgi:DNA-binding SARP family transcriptional activator